MLASAVAVMMAASCSGNSNKCNTCDGDKCAAEVEDKTEVFSGVLPAADAAGVRYTLKLEYDNTKDSVKGDYDLQEVYLVAENGTEVLKDSVQVKSDGDFAGFEKDGKKYLCLTDDDKTSSAPLYFLVDSDSTITLVNSELEPSATPDLNYTLKIVK